MTNLERTNAELRAALIVAGKRIVKLNFGRREDRVLPITEARAEEVASGRGGGDSAREYSVTISGNRPQPMSQAHIKSCRASRI